MADMERPVWTLYRGLARDTAFPYGPGLMGYAALVRGRWEP
jgi:hypothetical protein